MSHKVSAASPPGPSSHLTDDMKLRLGKHHKVAQWVEAPGSRLRCVNTVFSLHLSPHLKVQCHQQAAQVPDLKITPCPCLYFSSDENVKNEVTWARKRESEGPGLLNRAALQELIHPAAGPTHALSAIPGTI